MCSKPRGTPSGRHITFNNIRAYLATPPDGPKKHPNTAILWLADVLGIWQNAMLLADQFAANGYITLIPDLFNGDQLPPNVADDFDFMGWIEEGTGGKNPHTIQYIDPIVSASVQYLRTEYGASRIGGAGYCFGAKYVVRQMASGGGIDVGYVAHPSFVDVEEIKALQGPICMHAAETDEIFPETLRHQTETLLKEKKSTYSCTVYSGVSHGFTVRANLKDPKQKWAQEDAFVQSVRFFDHWLSANETSSSRDVRL